MQLARLDEMARLDEADFEGAGIGINEALPLFHKMINEGDNLDRVAFNAWSKLRANLLAYQQGLERYEDAQIFVSSLERDDPRYNSAMSKFAKLCGEWRTASFKLPRAIKNNLAATPLLAHAGVPKDLINSPEWATMRIEAETAQMEREAALFEAQLRQIQAKQRQVDVAKRMAALQRELDDALNPKKAEPVEPQITKLSPDDPLIAEFNDALAGKLPAKSNGGIRSMFGMPSIPSYTHR
jgi:hypothetical protein